MVVGRGRLAQRATKGSPCLRRWLPMLMALSAAAVGCLSKPAVRIDTSCAVAEDPHGMIRVDLVDPMGEVPRPPLTLPEVRITNTLTLIKVHGTPDAGRRAMFRLMPGIYAIELGEGYPWKRTRTTVTLERGCTIAVFIRLQFGEIAPDA